MNEQLADFVAFLIMRFLILFLCLGAIGFSFTMLYYTGKLAWMAITGRFS